MYLPNKIIKILSNMNKSYIIYYTNGKITSVIIDSENIKIEAKSKGYCINIKGAQVIVDDLKSIEPLLYKVSVSNKIEEKKSKFKIAESLVDIFSENGKSFAVKYNQGNVISIIIDNPKLDINKTSSGYLLNVNNKNIAVESFPAIKKLLLKMQIIEDKNCGKKEKEYKKIYKNKKDFEQLRLEI